MPRFLVKTSDYGQFRIATAESAEEAVRMVADEVPRKNMVFPLIVNLIDDENTRRFDVTTEYQVREV